MLTETVVTRTPFANNQFATTFPSLRGDATNDTNFSVMRDFRAGKRMRFQVRGEGYSVVNIWGVEYAGESRVVRVYHWAGEPAAAGATGGADAVLGGVSQRPPRGTGYAETGGWAGSVRSRGIGATPGEAGHVGGPKNGGAFGGGEAEGAGDGGGLAEVGEGAGDWFWRAAISERAWRARQLSSWRAGVGEVDWRVRARARVRALEAWGRELAARRTVAQEEHAGVGFVDEEIVGVGLAEGGLEGGDGGEGLSGGGEMGGGELERDEVGVGLEGGGRW